jgi:hypothetical protein
MFAAGKNTAEPTNKVPSEDTGDGQKGILENIKDTLVTGKTPAVKNMESAWNRAGSGSTHTPGMFTNLTIFLYYLLGRGFLHQTLQNKCNIQEKCQR